MIVEAAHEILSALRHHKLRTFLTALSVAWGTFMLTLLLGAGRGLENGVAWEFRDDALASISVRPSQTSLPYAGRKPGRDVRFTDEDLDAVDRLPGVEHATGRFYYWGQLSVSRGSRRASFDVRGVHPDHRHLERTEMTHGRFVNDRDLRERRKIAVIGSEVRTMLFAPHEDPIGEYIEIRGLPYRVVGVFEDQGGQDEQRKIYVPISTAQAVYRSPGRLHHLLFTLTTEDVPTSQRIADATLSLLKGRHEVHPDDRRAIRIHNNLERFGKITEVFTWIRAFVWIVGCGTLLAGVIGVGNILLISVAERTKEFGIRKALGATPRSIVGMVVVEGLVITLTSGYAGVVLGVGLLEVVSKALPAAQYFRNPGVELDVALGAVALLAISGTLAGLVPALRAARVDPMVALREGD
ncbi:MAG: ABC transporter permease [Pseudomonadota bacterium]|nr:MAG: ABC transporter permease [Pseudomonadota bacterium]